MQPSPNAQLKPVPITSPRSPSSSHQERSASPGKTPVRLASRSPNAHPALGAELRMNDFYTIDSHFKSLRVALKPDAKRAGSFAPAPALAELAAAIQTSMTDAEHAFMHRNHPRCHLYLTAAKANQIGMLAQIDDTPDARMSAERRTALRDSCVLLGDALTEMMIKAKAKADEVRLEAQQRWQDYRGDESRLASSPPPGPAASGDRQAGSPARSSQKRAQGEADSPVLAQSPLKRRKTETGSPAPARAGDSTATAKSPAGPATPTAATASASTASTASRPPSHTVPSYRLVPQLHIVCEATGKAPGDSPKKPDTPRAGASATPVSPGKMRTLGPQPKPRPASQLFVAPPDFSCFAGPAQNAMEGSSSTATLPASQPDAMAGKVVSQPQPDPGSADQTR